MKKPVANFIPFSWFEQHFAEELLPRWHEASVTKNGLFHPVLDRKWNKNGETKGNLVSQSRLLYVFSVGFLMTGNQKYKETVKSGADFLLHYFYDKTNSGFYWSCDQNGKVLEDFKHAYGHAFLILGFVFVYKVTGEKKYLKTAAEIYFLIEEKFRDEFGGLVWRKSCHWLDLDKHRAQNPLMHYLEAIIALFEILKVKKTTNEFFDNLNLETLRKRAEQIVDFLFTSQKQLSEFLLWEFYSLDWKPLQLIQSGPFSSGHHFEWAFLLSYGIEVGLLKKEKLPLAKHCLKSALKIGYQENGKIRSYMHKDGTLTDHHLYWWDFSEALRTLVHFIIQHEQHELIPVFQNILTFVQKHFLDSEFGGWYFSLDSTGNPLNTIKGHFGKLDYHQTGLCLEVSRLKSQ